MSGHLGGDLAALVDGELGHAARERALRHLAHCSPCRAEVEAERRLKARLLGLSATAPLPAPELADRLVALAATDPVPARSGWVSRSGPRSRDDHRGPGRRRRLTRRAAGGAALALGLGAVLALGAPHRPVSRPAVDPASDVFLVDHALVTGEVPLSGQTGVTSAGLSR